MGYREMERAEERNASLEKQCDEAHAERSAARQAANLARDRLQERHASLKTLKTSLRDHSRRLSEKLGVLDQELREMSSPENSFGDALPPTEPEVPRSRLQNSDASRPVFSGPEEGGGAPPHAAHTGALDSGCTDAQRIQHVATTSRCANKGGKEVKVESSIEDGTPTQDADAAAGAAITSVGGHAEPSTDNSRVNNLSPSAKRRRLPPSVGDCHGISDEASIGNPLAVHHVNSVPR